MIKISNAAEKQYEKINTFTSLGVILVTALPIVAVIVCGNLNQKSIRKPTPDFIGKDSIKKQASQEKVNNAMNDFFNQFTNFRQNTISLEEKIELWGQKIKKAKKITEKAFNELVSESNLLENQRTDVLKTMDDVFKQEKSYAAIYGWSNPWHYRLRFNERILKRIDKSFKVIQTTLEDWKQSKVIEK